ncbi:MAG: hypothetical protein AABY26_04270 [Nanoarchaeota archaeon]
MKTLTYLACITSLSLVTGCSSEEDKLFPSYPECVGEGKSIIGYDAGDCEHREVFRGTLEGLPAEYVLSQVANKIPTWVIRQIANRDYDGLENLASICRANGFSDINFYSGDITRSCFVSYQEHLIYHKSCGSSSVDQVVALGDYIGGGDRTTSRAELTEAGKADYYDHLLSLAREEIFLPQAEKILEEREENERVEEEEEHRLEKQAKEHRLKEVGINF